MSRLPGSSSVASGIGAARACSALLAAPDRALSAGQIWAAFQRRYGPSLVLLEHYLAPGGGGGH